ncbi:hypothetical protein AB833_29830 [Chromatiales bacterium (ex Bugula neritina AB1)]|nr:hypothetical protein AB833_29830 [Chromatiales bacterium (ex Bugula neritina AB1)]
MIKAGTHKISSSKEKRANLPPQLAPLPLAVVQLLFAAVLLYLTSQPVSWPLEHTVAQQKPAITINIPIATVANASVETTAILSSPETLAADSYTN